MQKGPAQVRDFIVKTMKHWLQDTDLAGVRNREALAALPEVERKDWQALWGRVEKLVRRAEGAEAEKPEPPKEKK